MRERLIDGRDLQPPEPLELALAELATLAQGEVLVLLLRCEPLPLYSLLEREGFVWRSIRGPDGTNEIRIQKAPD